MKLQIISTNFSFEEFEHSIKADELKIDNHIPSEQIRTSIRILVHNVLQPLRDHIGKPLVINSGYRCKVLNSELGGSITSQHLKGEAADLRCQGTTEVLLLAQTVIRYKIPFDQMVLYDKFLHISFNSKGRQRQQVIYDESYKTHLL